MNTASQEQATPSPRHISEQQMKGYFSSIKSILWLIILLTLSAFFLLLFGLVSQDVIAILFGFVLCLIVAGIFLARVLGSTIRTDAEYDAWIKDQADQLLRRAMRTLNIERQTTKGYVQIHGFVLPGMRESYQYNPDELLSKRVKDGRVRFSVNVYTYFFLTDHSVIVFSGDVNALNQSSRKEKTQEYFNHDIVGVTTSDEQNLIEQYQYRVQYFSLRVSNGDTIDVSASASPVDTRENLPRFTVIDSGIDRTVTQLRKILREAKQSE